MTKKLNPAEITVGVIGLGLMGSSIVTSLLIAGHVVKAVAPLPEDLRGAPERVLSHLRHCEHSGLLLKLPKDYMHQLTISDSYEVLQPCDLILECVIEIPDIKSVVYQKIEAVVSGDAVIASNTSAIPISELQQLLTRPERFLGIHWAEPSYLTRFMEITCGDQTAPLIADWIFELAHHWGKEPTLLRKDIRGFVTNRLMYAVYREGFSLVEKGQATLQDVDKSFRYDAGSWMTLMGLFRRMDFTGLNDYPEIFRNIFPSLSNDQEVPAIMKQMIEQTARGTQNLKGLYSYTAEEAEKLDAAFAAFNEEIYQLASRYPASKTTTSVTPAQVLDSGIAP